MNTKVCTKCKEEKPQSEFYKDHSKKDGLRSYCKVCGKHYSVWWNQNNPDCRERWYKENRERALENGKKWNRKNRRSVLEAHSRWKKNNPDYQRHYYQKNREKFAFHRGKYRALKRDGVPGFLEGCSVEKQRLVQIYKLRDLLTEATGIEHHVDHIWPLSKGGPHWSGNLQIITAEENLRKGDSLCEETARVIKESLDEYCSPRLRK